MNQVKYLFCLSLLFVISSSATAQMKGWELGAWLGGSNYFGDLNTEWRVNRTKPAGGFGARYNFNDRLSFKLGVSAGMIEANDADSRNFYEQRRNLHFRSLLFDATAQLEFNFLPYVHGHREYYYTPYVFLGPSFYQFNPQAELDGEWYNLREYGTEGQFKGEEYNTAQGAIAYGVGFKIDLSYRWSLNVELSGRRLMTDYLDDVSGVYGDPDDIRTLRGDLGVMLADRSEEPKIGDPGRQRGNGKNNDMFYFAGVSVFYYFGQIRCPEFLR